jgi:hypothetical protein
MGDVESRSFLFFLLMTLLAGCAAIEEKIVSTGSSTPPGTTYSCFDYGMYDDQSTCNNLTLAQCAASWQSFPGGGIQPCYSPVAGGEACLTLTPTPEWIYSEYNDPNPSLSRIATYCKKDTAGTQHHRLRSLVGCSSTVCLCQGNISPYNSSITYIGWTDPTELCCPGYSSPICTN